MLFEYDEHKDKENQDKHGISFDEARHLWNDLNMVSVKVSRNNETRYFALARQWGRVWVAVYTLRGESIRLISVRAATKKEAAIYDKANS